MSTSGKLITSSIYAVLTSGQSRQVGRGNGIMVSTHNELADIPRAPDHSKSRPFHKVPTETMVSASSNQASDCHIRLLTPCVIPDYQLRSL